MHAHDLWKSGLGGAVPERDVHGPAGLPTWLRPVLRPRVDASYDRGEPDGPDRAEHQQHDGQSRRRVFVAGHCRPEATRFRRASSARPAPGCRAVARRRARPRKPGTVTDFAADDFGPNGRSHRVSPDAAGRSCALTGSWPSRGRLPRRGCVGAGSPVFTLLAPRPRGFERLARRSYMWIPPTRNWTGAAAHAARVISASSWSTATLTRWPR